MKKGLLQKFPADFIEEVHEMREDGLTLSNIAWYLGVSIPTIVYILNPEKATVANNSWRNRNLARVKKTTAIYNKKYTRQKREEEKQRIVDLREELVRDGKLPPDLLKKLK